MSPGDFAVEAVDGAARAGVLETAHGTVRTPVFMPVGTLGTVKGVDPRELREIGTQILLGIATVWTSVHLHVAATHQVVGALVVAAAAWGAHSIGRRR